MSLFYENHDSPRMISKIDKRPEYRERLAKLLAVIQLTLKGTPFLYQGQELGSVNVEFESIEEISDIESKNLYKELINSMDEKSAFKKILAGSREHARIPIDWNKMGQSEVVEFYRQLIDLRKKDKALIYGNMEITNKDRKNIFSYYRKNETAVYYILCNISSKVMKKPKLDSDLVYLISNYEYEVKNLRPYEAIIYRR